MATKNNGTKTQGEAEAAVCELVSRFHRDTMGRGPKSISATLRCRSVVVQLEGVLTTVEETLTSSSHSSRDGIDMVRQLRERLVQGARTSLLRGLTHTLGEPAVGMMHDVDPESDAAVFVFNLACEPKSIRLRA